MGKLMLNITHTGCIVARPNDFKVAKESVVTIGDKSFGTVQVKDCDIYIVCSRNKLRVKPTVLPIPIHGNYAIDMDLRLFEENEVNRERVRLFLGEQASYLGSKFHQKCYTLPPYDSVTLAEEGSSINSTLVSLNPQLKNSLPANYSQLRVEYVGQSKRGHKGKGASIGSRLNKHEKIQEITSHLLDHEPHKEVVVILIRLEYQHWGAMMLGNLPGVFEAGYDDPTDKMDTFLNNPLSKENLIDVAEALLINGFKPKWNITFKKIL